MLRRAVRGITIRISGWQNATEIKLHGISIEDAGKNIVRVDLHAPKKKRVLWHTKGDAMKQAIVEVFARGGNVSQAHKYLIDIAPDIYQRKAPGLEKAAQ